MTAKLTAQVAFLAVLGIVVAAGIGLLTNAIAGDSVGLSASPLRAGNLAPPQARTKSRGASGHDTRHDRRERRQKARTGDDDSATTITAPTTTTAAPTTTTTSGSGELEPFDDHGGSSNSGSGSSSSGSGSSGSGGGFDD